MQTKRVVALAAVLLVPAIALVAAPNEQAPAQKSVPASDTLRFVAHEEHVAAGFPSRARPLALRNPYEGSAQAVKTGAQLFVAYNCIDCHGADGAGAMAPSLADGRWHFGGGAAEVFESIYQGRPDGMPTWGGRITDDQIWMLATYVRSLSAGKQVSTENFTGRTVERTGH
jgi:cytochrome c oxidase cbb3-type subunit 3